MSYLLQLTIELCGTIEFKEQEFKLHFKLWQIPLGD
jgi:hypothetical protein